MRERPILFSAPMVRALLAGTKTQTRRVCKLDMRDGMPGPEMASLLRCCPYGIPGDRLWVREAWRVTEKHDDKPPRDLTPRKMTVFFDAGGSIANQRSGKWERDDDLMPPGELLPWVGRLRHGMFMPRWACRLELEITDVRVQRLKDISEKDARAEGSACVDEFTGREVLFPDACNAGSWRLGYRVIWEGINGPGSWDANPWVWVVAFKVL